ncbi:hypothetical protein [Nostoc sp.]|uniref:hypothetical protein n=1 Tax=Nostoc sp. TaxID=1180 RepID=UPI002FF5DBD2
MAKVIPVSADASRRAAYYLYFIRAIASFQGLRSLDNVHSFSTVIVHLSATLQYHCITLIIK